METKRCKSYYVMVCKGETTPAGINPVASFKGEVSPGASTRLTPTRERGQVAKLGVNNKLHKWDC